MIYTLYTTYLQSTSSHILQLFAEECLSHECLQFAAMASNSWMLYDSNIALNIKNAHTFYYHMDTV